MKLRSILAAALAILFSTPALAQQISPTSGNTYTASSPVVVTGTVISCPTCATSAGVTLGSSASANSPYISGDLKSGLFSAATSTVSIATGGVQALTVSPSQQVGIGTSGPNSPLTINTPSFNDTAGTTGIQLTGNINNFYQMLIQNTNAGSSASADIVIGGNDMTATTHYADFGKNGSNGATTPFANADAAYFYTVDNEFDIGATAATGAINLAVGSTPTTMVTIGTTIITMNENVNVASGSVGIGTSSPTVPLNVVGAATITGAVSTGNLNLTSSSVPVNGMNLVTTNTISLYANSGVIGGWASGEFLVGPTTNNGGTAVDSASVVYPRLYVNSATANSSNAAFRQYTNDAVGAKLWLNKSRNTTVGSHTTVQTGDNLGTINFSGSDGTVFQTGAQITANANGTIGSGIMPSDLRFLLTPSGTNVPALSMIILPSGSVGIGTASPVSQLDVFGGGVVSPPTTVAISTATFTPSMATGTNFAITLVHASCPCTLANPTVVNAGQSGVIAITQSATGSDTIGTWGSEYEYVGGTSTITLSTAANTTDLLPYYAVDSTHIIFGTLVKGAAH